MNDDDYPTCAETFASLRIFGPSQQPEYMWGTKGVIESKDLRRHLDAVISHIEGAPGLAARIAAQRADVMCFWSSRFGHGGPTFSPEQMKALGELGVELWVDFYDSSEGDNAT